MDHPILAGTKPPHEWGYSSLGALLEDLKEVAIETNKEWSSALEVNQSAAITCVKPSGTVSQLVDSASGIHARFAPYYIRRVRADVKDPLAKMMIDAGFPHEKAIGNDSVYVFSFPMKAPEEAVFVKDVEAIPQLEHWLTYQRHWCEHKPSVTVYYKPEEMLEVGAWVHRHFDEMSGISFLPVSDHTYDQAPYEEIDKETYEMMLNNMPKDVDWTKLGEYELEDRTAGTKTMACTGGVCEIVDLVNS